MSEYLAIGASIVERQAAEMHKLNSQCKLLTDKVDNLQTRLSSIGLTTEELQGIHGLIQGQIKLIAELQTAATDGDYVRELCILVETLESLAFLASKPTD